MLVKERGVGSLRLKALGRVLIRTRAFTVRRKGTGQINVRRSGKIREDPEAQALTLGKTEEVDSEVRTKTLKVEQR